MFRRTAIWSLSLALAAAAPLVVASDDAAPVAEPPKAEAPMPKPVRAAVCTGSRIRPALGQPCPSTSALRSYSQTDLQRTGQIQVYDALRLLDPIFR
jgi:hypothetical protein